MTQPAPDLPSADPTNPLLGPVPAMLTCSVARDPAGQEIGVLTIRHPAGSLTLFIDRDTLTKWGVLLRTTADRMTGIIVTNGQPVAIPKPGR